MYKLVMQEISRVYQALLPPSQMSYCDLCDIKSRTTDISNSVKIEWRRVNQKPLLNNPHVFASEGAGGFRKVRGSTPDECATNAMSWLEDVWLSSFEIDRKVNVPVIVWDLDDTLILSSSGKCILPACETFRTCQRKGFHCALVTARPNMSDNWQFTERQMIDQDMIPCSTHLMPVTREKLTLDDIAEYKQTIRGGLGHIAASIGNSWSDLFTVGDFQFDFASYCLDDEATYVLIDNTNACCYLKLAAREST